MTNYEVWQAVLAEFELEVSKANFNTWFNNTGIASFDAGHVVICVPNTFSKSWLEQKYHKKLVQVMERVTNKPVKRVEYKVEKMKNIKEHTCFVSEEPVSTQKTPVFSNVDEKIKQAGLQKKYAFETYIVGKDNELAFAAAKAAAEKPGVAYNPLFIYGDVGLGKTHLMQAVGITMLKNNPTTKILYVTSEQFTHEFVTAIKNRSTDTFKQRYRNVDLLLIDDVQFIAGKEQTQEELFHTFNHLHQRNKQVVFTSDRPPKAIPALEDRLKSRFEWGMIADVSRPDYETRIAILQSKLQERGTKMDDQWVNLIATTIQSNIRELEGALNKVLGYHEIKKLAFSEDSIKEILQSFSEQNMRRAATPRDILEAVVTFFDIDMTALLGKGREKKISFPRQIAMYLLREELDLSYPAIGQELGGRDHTTAIHAYSKIEKALHDDLKIKQDIELIKQRLYANKQS